MRREQGLRKEAEGRGQDLDQEAQERTCPALRVPLAQPACNSLAICCVCDDVLCNEVCVWCCQLLSVAAATAMQWSLSAVCQSVPSPGRFACTRAFIHARCCVFAV